MPSLNGYGTLDDTNDTAAETFVTEGLAKVLKINNICDADHLTDCGIPDKITTMEGGLLDSFTSNYRTLATFNKMFNGSFSHSGWGSAADTVYSYNQKDTKAAAFETQNGESILVYYNPNCQPVIYDTGWSYTQPKMCANFVYDLNGSKGPNTVGKDIGFITALNPSDPIVVAPMPLNRRANTSAQNLHSAIGLCKAQDPESRLPNRDEAMSMFTNISLLKASTTDTQIWHGIILTSSKNSQGAQWNQSMSTGHQISDSLSGGGNYYVHCIKR